MSWRPSDSAGDPEVKGRGRAVRTASRFAGVVPHAVAATGSGKFGREHSGQGDFVKLVDSAKVRTQPGKTIELKALPAPDPAA